MALNVEHINKVLAHIRENPKRLHMPLWGIKSIEGQSLDSFPFRFSKDYLPECNTLACFAGWSKILATPKEEVDSIFDGYGHLVIDGIIAEESDRLGLTQEEGSYLFFKTTGTHQEQLEVVENRLRRIVLDRVRKGETEAAGVNVDVDFNFL